MVAVPLRDLPPSGCALAFLTGDDVPARDTFAAIVASCSPGDGGF